MTTRVFLFVALTFVIGCSPRKAKNADDLFELVKSGDLEAVRLTVDADKRLANARRSDGVSLPYLAAANGHKAILAYLLDAGATIDAKTKYGSALHVAVENEFEDIVRDLLARKADPRLQDDWKQAPLHNATKNKSDAIAKLLTDAGADPNAHDYKGRTALHRCKSLAVAKLLISRGADVNAVDDSGYTPLHWAATPREIVDRPTIEFLLTQGADASRLDKAGLTARELAKKNHQNELISLLDAYKP